MQELKANVINFKSLDQDIKDPIVAGAGDVNGRTLKLIFTQEAAAQFATNTKVYLSWRHNEKDIVGYNIFDKVNNDPQIWQIHWPQKMLFEGTALCRIELVDNISVTPSVNFLVKILSNPNDGSTFVESDDFSVFQQAILDGNHFVEEMKQKVEEQKLDITEIQNIANEAIQIAQEALEKVSSLNPAQPVPSIQLNRII